MLPTLCPESKLLLENTDLARIKEGELIAFEVPGRDDIVVHRLIKKQPLPSGDTIITKADNYPYLDQEIPKAHLVGRISSIKKSGRDAERPIVSNSVNSRVYLMLGRMLLFARQKKSFIPKIFHATLEKTFTFCHNLIKKFTK